MAANAPRVVPTPNDICWELAVKVRDKQIFNTTLTKDPKKVLTSSAVNPNHSPSNYQQLLQAAQDARTTAEAKQSSFRAAMESVLTTVDQYAAAIDVAIQQQPDITAIVWGCMRAMITVAVKDIQLSEEIGDALVKVTKELGRWERVLLLFPDSKRLQEAAAGLFAQIINYLVRASKYYRTKHGARLVKAGFTPALTKLRRILEDIDDLSRQFDRETSLASSETLANDRKVLEDQSRELKAEVGEQERFRQDSRQYMSDGPARHLQLKDAIIKLQTAMKDDSSLREENEKVRLLESQRQAALLWLRSAVYTHSVSTTWEENTCKWITEHPNYRLWKADKARSILWIYGIPGCGKTVMASYLSQNSQSPITFTHFFSRSNDGRSTKPVSLAASFLTQLLQHSSDMDAQALRDVLLDIVSLMHSVSTWEQSSFRRLWTILEQALPHLPEFTAIVDGLDECTTDDDHAEILRHLHFVATLPQSQVVITSRPTDVLKRSMLGAVDLAMDADTVSDDILHYVKQETNRNPRLQRVGSQVLAKTKRSAGGMFLWARMLLSCVTSAPTPRIQLERLERFPTGLSQIYDNFLAESALLLDAHELELQKSIFMLLVAATRPLSPEEVSVALALQAHVTHLDDQDLLLEPRREIQRLCWPLVTTQGDSTNLIHASVAEYLLMPRTQLARYGSHFSNSECQSFMARKCLYRMLHTDLTSVNFIEPLMKQNVTGVAPLINFLQSTAWTFLQYAYDYWHTHLVQPLDDTEVISLLAQFLQGLQFVTWLETVSQPSNRIGPIVTVRLSLKSLHQSLKPQLQSQLSLDGLFVQPYTEIYQRSGPGAQLSLLSCLALQRLTIYYYDNGMFPEGRSRIETWTEIVNGFRATLGHTHEITMRCVTERAVMLLAVRQFSDAESILMHNAMLQLQHHGDNVADSYISRSWAAHAMLAQCRYKEAEEHLTIACNGLLRILGHESRDYIMARLWLGWIWEARNKYGRALEIYETNWKTWTRSWGTDNAISMAYQFNLGIILRKLKDYEGAEKHLLASLGTRTAMYGKDHFITCDAAVNVAILYFEMDRLEEAEAQFEPFDTESQDRLMVERACQINHIRALIAARKCDFEEAESLLQAGLSTSQQPTGRENYLAERVWMRLTLADLLRRRGEPEAAKGLFQHLAFPLDNHTSSPIDLTVVESAARQARRKQFLEASETLRSHALAWRTEDLFWGVDDVPLAETPQLEFSTTFDRSIHRVSPAFPKATAVC